MYSGNVPFKDDIYLLFDLETTDLIRYFGITAIYPDICQIAILDAKSNDLWSSYLVPKKDMNPISSKMTKLQIKEYSGERVLTKDGVVLPAKKYEEGLHDIYQYIDQLANDHRRLYPNGRIVLVAHNCKRFDGPVLLNALKTINVSAQALEGKGVYFADSLEIFKAMKRRDKSMFGDARLSMVSLYRLLFGQSIDDVAHDAVEDSKALKKVLFESPVTRDVMPILSSHIFTLK
jgi:DNA polymerase III epsilon subunit-like protein